MVSTPPSSWPFYSAEEADAAARIISSGKVNYWTGEEGRKFEREFAEWVGTNHAVAVANGTVALELALRGLGIGPGDEVIVTPRTFIASVSSVVNIGATPIFADVDRESGNISPETIKQVLTSQTKAIVPVHLAGWPCDMLKIMRLAEVHGLKVIEDCAQAHGAKIDGRSVGSFGDVAAWSFCQDKIMTTGGEGGMVTTNDKELWSRMWSYKDHGKDWDNVYNRPHPPGFRLVHESFGTNWRILEIQAAIGRIQLERMTNWTARRAANAMIITESLTKHSDIIRVPLPAPGQEHAFYRLYCYANPAALAKGWSRDRIVQALIDAEVPVMHGTCSEVYLEKAFDGTNWRPSARLPFAAELGETSMAFLVHPTIGELEATEIADRIDTVLASIERD